MGILHTFPRAATASRNRLIGASAAPTILGISPWQTPFGLWLQMQGGDHGPPNAAMKRGTFLEPGILAWTASEVGAVETEPGIPISEPGIAGPEAWSSFHPDGALLMPDGAWRLAEIKTSRMASEWGDSGGDEIPLHYLAQVQYQLACTPGIAEAQVGVYLPMADELRCYVVATDAAFQREMLDRIGEWYHRHIVLGHAPEVDGSPAAAKFLRDRHPVQRGEIRMATDGEALLLHELADVKASIKAMEDREALLAAQIKAAIGDDEGLQVPGIGKATWRAVSGAERVDSKRLRAEYPAAAAACTVRGDDRRDLRFWPAK